MSYIVDSLMYSFNPVNTLPGRIQSLNVNDDSFLKELASIYKLLVNLYFNYERNNRKYSYCCGDCALEREKQDIAFAIRKARDYIAVILHYSNKDKDKDKDIINETIIIYLIIISRKFLKFDNYYFWDKITDKFINKAIIYPIYFEAVQHKDDPDFYINDFKSCFLISLKDDLDYLMGRDKDNQPTIFYLPLKINYSRFPNNLTL